MEFRFADTTMQACASTEVETVTVVPHVQLLELDVIGFVFP
jgi:hypothetical protein